MFKYLFIPLLFINTAYTGNGGIAGGSSSKLTPNSSWEEIRQHKHKIKLDNTWAFVGQSTNIFEVCIDGENLRTIKKRPFYKNVQRGNRDSSPTQVLEGYRHYSFPISYERRTEICNNRDRNCRTTYENVYQETVRDIDVSKYVRSVGSKDNRQEVYEKLFTKEYEVPLCTEIDEAE